MKKLKKLILGFALGLGIISAGLFAQPTQAAVGDSIAATFPDANLANAVAFQVAGGNINAILTQPMVDLLTTLNINAQGVSDLTGIDALTALTELSAGNNQITSIPANIGGLTNLTSIYLQNNQLTSVPDTIGNLTNLVDLYLNGNQISTIPDSIGDLDNLRGLHLDSNQLVSLPENIWNLDNITNLSFSGNQINEISASIGNLTTLEYLFAQYNNITSLPSSIGSLTSLKDLIIYGNQLTSLPDSIGNLTALESLSAGYNQLTSLPDSIGNLTSLAYLALSSNQLTSLPESIGNLTALAYLELDDNQLASLPESFGNLTLMRQLYLSNNQLTKLPDGFGNLTLVNELYLYGNQLTSLPESVTNMKTVLELEVSYNLLPTDYRERLVALGWLPILMGYEQDKLELGSVTPIIIKNQADIDNIDYLSFLTLLSGYTVFSSHNFILENYVDENNQPVNMDDYIKNGIVQKTGSVYAQVRATGTGLFPNNSDNAITDGQIQLNFEATLYDLSFDLNGALGTVPTTQSLVEGETGTTITNPIRDGYTFKGWNTEADGSGTAWELETTPMQANNVTLYAQWEENTKPVPPVPPTPDNKDITNGVTNGTTGSQLPQTGNYAIVLSGLILLGIGSLLVIKKIKGNF